MSEDEYAVPGSRPRKQHNAAAVAEAAKDRWDANPRQYRVNGKVVDLFPIGAVAKAMQREVVTIRSWERRGWFPKPSMRGPGEHKHRLYTRTFIEGAIKIAEEEGIFKPGTLIGSTNFPHRVITFYAKVGG